MTDLGKGLYAVSVPEDATEIGFGNHCLGYKTKLEPPSDTNGFTHAKEPQYLFCNKDFEILGTVTASGIDFDVEPCVETEDLYLVEGFKDYSGNNEIILNAIESFRSLLYSKGLHFENPYGKQRPFIVDDDAGTEREWLGYNWQQAESNLLQKLIILKRL